MNRSWISGVVVACGLMLMAGVGLADKAAVEQKAQAGVTFHADNMAADKALDVIARVSMVTIKKVDMPAQVPKVTVDLQQVSVLNAVKIIADAAGFSYSISDDGFVVSGKKKK